MQQIKEILAFILFLNSRELRQVEKQREKQREREMGRKQRTAAMWQQTTHATSSKPSDESGRKTSSFAQDDMISQRWQKVFGELVRIYG